MISFTLILFCAFLLVIIVFHKNGYISFYENATKTKYSHREVINNYLLERFPILIDIFEGNLIFKLFLPLIIFFLISYFLSQRFTNQSLGLILSITMTFTYFIRNYFHKIEKFRSRFLSEIKRLFFSIRNQLSSGISLDQALIKDFQNSKKYSKNFQAELSKFIKISSSNTLDDFPNWLLKIKNIYQLKGIDQVAQFIKLELKYNNNQEEAFEGAIECISHKIEQNARQKNSISISLLTIDFISLIFLGLVLFVIPILSQTDSTWWESSRRELIVFLSAISLCLVQFFSILFFLRGLS